MAGYAYAGSENVLPTVHGNVQLLAQPIWSVIPQLKLTVIDATLVLISYTVGTSSKMFS